MKASLVDVMCEIIRRDEWRSAFDGLSVVTLMAALQHDAFLSACSLEQLEAIAKRLPFGKTAKRPPRDGVFLHVIYRLFDVNHPEMPVYVGRTCKLHKRWANHRLVSESAYDVPVDRLRIEVIETLFAIDGEASDAELRHIQAARVINPNLKNKVG